MIRFKIAGKEYMIPSEYKDSILTYRMYTNLSRGTTLDVVSVVTGIDVKTLSSAQVDNIGTLLSTLSFLNETPEWNRTETIGFYKVPKSPVLETLGQFEDLRALLNRFPKDVNDPAFIEKASDLYLESCAIYMQKVRDGQYDHDKAIDMKEELKDCQVNEILGNGAFFLMMPLSLSTSTKADSPKPKSPPKKKKPVSAASRKSSGRSRR